MKNPSTTGFEEAFGDDNAGDLAGTNGELPDADLVEVAWNADVVVFVGGVGRALGVFWIPSPIEVELFSGLGDLKPAPTMAAFSSA